MTNTKRVKWAEGKSDAKINKSTLCAAWYGLPGRHAGQAVLTLHCFPPSPYCWWRLQDHQAGCSVDHNYPPIRSTPALGTTVSFSISCVITKTQFKEIEETLLLQSFGSDFQLYPLVLLTPQRFRLTVVQILYKCQLRTEDLQELLDHQETTNEKVHNMTDTYSKRSGNKDRLNVMSS